jgi:hypothetical protein
MLAIAFGAVIVLLTSCGLAISVANNIVGPKPTPTEYVSANNAIIIQTATETEQPTETEKPTGTYTPTIKFTASNTATVIGIKPSSTFTLQATATNRPLQTAILYPTLPPQPTLAVVATLQPQPTAAPTKNCESSYPTVCIPPPPPNLNGKNVPYKRFNVLPPDPHGFDRDHDGIGCE